MSIYETRMREIEKREKIFESLKQGSYRRETTPIIRGFRHILAREFKHLHICVISTTVSEFDEIMAFLDKGLDDMKTALRSCPARKVSNG